MLPQAFAADSLSVQAPRASCPGLLAVNERVEGLVHSLCPLLPFVPPLSPHDLMASSGSDTATAELGYNTVQHFTDPSQQIRLSTYQNNLIRQINKM